MRKTEIMAFIDFESKVNAINPVYMAKLGVQVQRTDIGTPKIDASS